MNESQGKERRIGVYVDPEIKEWAREEARKRKWSLSLFCCELLRAAMNRDDMKADGFVSERN